MARVGSTHDGVRVKLDRYEADVLRSLIAEMKTLLEADVPRVDPVIRRLFPDAYEDAQEEESFRELVGDDLNAAKRDALRAVEEKLDGAGSAAEVEFRRAEVDHWLTLLTDMRLAIGTRVDVTEEMMGREPEPDDPDAPALSLLHWLSYLQEATLNELREEN
jgi:Domain of unknown function (DUF2017)